MRTRIARAAQHSLTGKAVGYPEEEPNKKEAVQEPAAETKYENQI